MNRGKIIIIVGLLLLTMTMWWWLARPSSVSPAVPLPTQPSHVSVPTTDVDPSTQQLTTPVSADAQKQRSEEKQQQYLEKARSQGNQINRPAKFYGRILDQNNQAVSSVTIKCGLSRFGDIVLPGLKPHYTEFERISDADGRFVVDDQNGLALDLNLLPKQGYEFKPDVLQVMLRDEGLNKPAPALSTSDKPYIFRAFKKGQAEALIKGAIAFYDCEPDGRSYTAQLRNNRVVEGRTGGDFRISLQRPLGWANQTDYDWTVQIDGVDMELLETRDMFMYQAPAAGYNASWSIAKKAGGEDYMREVSPKFYIRSRDGAVYGRIEFRIKSDSRERSAVLMYYWLNSNGSRNLEYDPLLSEAKPLAPSTKP